MYFRNLIKLYFREKKPILGRWSITSSKSYLDHKIYLANHDHCGPCGKLFLKSDKLIDNKNK